MGHVNSLEFVVWMNLDQILCRWIDSWLQEHCVDNSSLAVFEDLVDRPYYSISVGFTLNKVSLKIADEVRICVKGAPQGPLQPHHANYPRLQA